MCWPKQLSPYCSKEIKDEPWCDEIAMNTEEYRQRKGGRKYTITLIIIVWSTALLLIDKLSGTHFVELVAMTLFFYNAANVGAAFAARNTTVDQGEWLSH